MRARILPDADVGYAEIVLKKSTYVVRYCNLQHAISTSGCDWNPVLNINCCRNQILRNPRNFSGADFFNTIGSEPTFGKIQREVIAAFRPKGRWISSGAWFDDVQNVEQAVEALSGERRKCVAVVAGAEEPPSAVV